MVDFFNAYNLIAVEDQLQDVDEARQRAFDGIADRILNDIRPQSVLHVGCVAGSLVQRLRARDVQAFGLVFEQHPARDIHPSLQSLCWVGSPIDALPQRYDLIVALEILQHFSSPNAEQAIANFCACTDDILFSSIPFADGDAPRLNTQPPEYWASQFAEHGFFRDVDFDGSFVTPWAARFRRTREPATWVIGDYERRWWQLQQESRARRALNLTQSHELIVRELDLQQARAQIESKDLAMLALATEKDRVIQELNARIIAKDQAAQELHAQLRSWQLRWAQLEGSPGWALLRALQMGRTHLAPPGSTRDQALEDLWRGLRTRQPRAMIDALRRIEQDVSRRARALRWIGKPEDGRTAASGRLLRVDPIVPPPILRAYQATVEVVVCVHDALADVRRCLESVVLHSNSPYALILVDDGSNAPTRDYLVEFAGMHGATLLRNERALGYTFAANRGLRHSTADYVVLLNSDTVVTPEWLNRMIACAETDPRIGLVGPLSNTASWQSIPAIESQGDWAPNPLPVGMQVEEMGQLVARSSARLYPKVPLLNGFCLLLRRELIREIGYFDEENFGAGYGEEDDFALRARKAGWSLAWADDVYVYHAQSRSYSDEKRQVLCDRAGAVVARKHGQQIIDEGVAFCRWDRVLEGIRARSRSMLARQEWVARGRARYAGHRVLFVLPVVQAGGGGNVVIDEAMAMREMGVDVGIFNLTIYRDGFEAAYPGLSIPVTFGSQEDLAALAGRYDAVIATHNSSVAWLEPIERQNDRPVRGYYVQGFEPYMYPPDTEDFRQALASYSLFPDLVRFTKTEWTRQEVKEKAGVDCAVVGVSLKTDLFRPRPRAGPAWPSCPLKVAAMVRSNAPYREPRLTMEILRRMTQRYGAGVEAVIFGTSADEPEFAGLAGGFSWTLAGVINQEQVARLMNEVDIFVDFSSHQAMGLAALEAMACGAAVIVPSRGGAVSFARDGVNALVVDTSSPAACWQALQRLIEDHNLRSRLQRNALIDVCDVFPERPAFQILGALFDGGYDQQNEPA